MQQPCEFSIVIPCLNEEKTLGICIRKAQSFLASQHTPGEIVIADNGSTDRSREIAMAAGVVLVDVPEKGYGSAIQGGMAAARGMYIIIGDADDSYDFSLLLPFLEKLRQGYDLVMGNRFLGGIEPGAMPFLHQYLGNPVLSGIGNLFFRSPIHDFHCGLRGINAETAKRLDLHATGMEFATEMVLKAIMKNVRITEVPTILHVDGRGKRSHLRTWRDGWRHLRLMLLYAPRWLFFYPGLLCVLAGIAVDVLLIPGQRGVFDVHTLLYANCFLVLGVNALTYALFARVFAMEAGLMPVTPLLKRVYGRHSLEIGLLGGSVLLLSGVAITLYAVLIWRAQHFSDLNPQQMLRYVIPATTLLFTGFQIILSSFFLSLLHIQRRPAKTVSE